MYNMAIIPPRTIQVPIKYHLKPMVFERYLNAIFVRVLCGVVISFDFAGTSSLH